MKISVVYALPERQVVREVELPAGSTIAEAVERSGLMRDFPEIGMRPAIVGIHGRVMPTDAILREGDRVEIYRKLRVDPKAARRRRARAG